MVKLRIILLLLLIIGFALINSELSAQCAMCKASAEEGAKDGNTQTSTLNAGIMYLLLMPYLAAMVIGYLWFRNYKRKKADGAEF